MNNSPSIIFNCAFCPPEIASEQNDFFRCKNSLNIIRYMDRNGAADKLSDADIEKIRSFVEDTSATGRSIIGYADKRQGSTGIFSKDHSDTPQTLAEKLKNTGSIIWHSVLSFTPEISTKFCSNKQDAEKLLRENFPYFFKNSPLDYNNIEWFAAYHTNTDNRHIHIVFWEKSPQIIDKNGNRKYRKKGVLPTENFDAFKAKISHYFIKHQLDYFSVRDEIRQGVSGVLKNDKNTFNALLRQSASILSDGHFQYARLNAEQKRVIDSYVQLIIRNTPGLNEQYRTYKVRLADSQALYIKLYTDNNIRAIPKSVTNFYSSRENELNSRLGNALLKQLKEYAMQKKQIEASVGYVNGAWSADSKLSPKSRKAVASKEIAALASSAMRLFVAEAAPEIEGRLQSDEEYRHQMQLEGKVTIYD